VATRLGLTETPALDLPVASAGALVGMSLAADVAPSRGPVLVVAAEIMSRIVLTEPLDPSVCILFGDGAGACLIHPSKGGAKVLGSVISTDGTFSEDLRLEDSTFLMNGRSVILQASRKMPRAVGEILRRFSLAASDVGTYLMHQANQNLMDRVADALGVDRGRFFSNIARYGNTSSASMLIAASEWAEREGFQAGSRVCFTAFGAGFHWGALLAEGVGPA
jgi:3-oxoacyl-[acyl-carrier-protein] synthase-3